ncbi:hypothetical protein DYI25_14375 [Mesobacillus boroniphilus]|uniref:Uncharacterized protein n=1 Tax=Mesobacillus boroniphilus TaxID=308892 RepID=A0A944GYK4_9BACI|nr:hypothetical protein [Mesobacillus boroniphilus]MBS8265611.1 hypothetical protein [Mesobacillus boroniphilus]
MDKKKLTLIGMVVIAGLLVFVGIMLAGNLGNNQAANGEAKQDQTQEANEGPGQEAKEDTEQEKSEGPNQETKKLTKEEKAEAKKDQSYLDYVPTITVDGQKIELYEFGDCIKKDEEEDSCVRVTEEEALKGKTASTFDQGAELEIKNVQSSGEVEDKNSPTGGVRRIGSFSLSRDGESLGPGDIATTVKELDGEYIETMKLPSEPGYYTGVLDNSTPTGSKNYVFHFNIK